MGKQELMALGLLGAAFVGGAALASTGNSQAPWFVSRAAGIGAFVALSLSVILGLLTSMRLGFPGLGRAFNFEIHGFVSVLGLTLVGIHGGSLLFDGFFHFTPAHLMIPFLSPYEPAWTGLGVIAAWGMAIVTASFWMRRWIGQRTWRLLHYVSFAVYLLAFFHGITSGTDTGAMPVALIYAASAVTVASLLALRIMVRGERIQAGRSATAADAIPAWSERPAPVRASLWFHREDATAGNWERS